MACRAPGGLRHRVPASSGYWSSRREGSMSVVAGFPVTSGLAQTLKAIIAALSPVCLGCGAKRGMARRRAMRLIASRRAMLFDTPPVSPTLR